MKDLHDGLLVVVLIGFTSRKYRSPISWLCLASKEGSRLVRMQSGYFESKSLKELWFGEVSGQYNKAIRRSTQFSIRPAVRLMNAGRSYRPFLPARVYSWPQAINLCSP